MTRLRSARSVTLAALSIGALISVSALAGCHRHARAVDAPPPPPPDTTYAPPPPPRPCDVIGAWHVDNPVPGGPQEVEIAPSPDGQAGAYMVKSRSGQSLGPITVNGANQVRVDTQYTNAIYKCEVQADCDTMICAFNGGQAPATFRRLR
jgi:hypothetical protein